eukprot:TRINITY_DN29305_c0_g1_i1.p1 TRINITY_DN29305_c0_g1~~TRINITY_DN29305_c0_g1_i1.p1  ORF type:complete len:155 (-),score=39.76 TRINITY_DN29305_c0_g1_i1:84-548(-)
MFSLFTAILNQLKLGEARATVPTVGFNVEEVTYGNLTFDVWDVGGQDRLRPLWRHYYRGASGIIFTIDAADENRFNLAKTELHKLMQEIELQYACLCVLANKQDIENAVSAEELAKILDVGSLEAPHVVLPSTARTGDGLEEAMNWLSENIKEV